MFRRPMLDPGELVGPALIAMLAAGLVATFVTAFILTGGGGEEEFVGEVTPTPAGTPGTPPPGGLAVSLVEFAVNPEQDTLAADTVTLIISNDGATVHNFLLIRTDLAPDALPKAGPQVDETAVDVVIATDLLVPGQTEQASVELDPGSYVLICNVPGHYDLGMRTALTVGS